MERILLLKEDDITKLTNISFNVDIDKITPFIYMAQKTKLKPLLGSELYEAIMTEFDEDTLAGDNLELYNDYIVDYLVYYTAYYFWSFGIYQLDNAGAYRTSVDNSEGLEEEAVIRVAKMWEQQAESVRIQLVKFLESKESLEESNSTNYAPNFNWYFRRGGCR
jgi:hypothetical protein